jgi:hypothetical protein
VLRPLIALRSILPEHAPEKIQTILGLEDLDLKPAMLDLQLKGPHFIVVGPPLSGKTTTLRSWVMALAHLYPPEEVALILVDLQQRFFKYGGAHTLGDLPHVLATVSEVEALTAAITGLQAEYAYALPPGESRPEIFVVIDNYDDFGNAISTGFSSKSTAYKDMGELARKFGPEGLHFIVGGSLAILRTNDDLMRQVLAPRYGLGLDASDAPGALGGRVRAGGAAAELPPGRGFIVKSGRTSMIQVATPQNEANIEQSLDAWVSEIIERYPQAAQWTKARLGETQPAEASDQPVTEPANQPAK